ncbi:MAG: hypothetical protein AAF755_05100 [Pseudomonadota bacterium]
MTRVLALSMTPQAARRLRQDNPKQEALLGGTKLNPAGVDIFPISDLGDLGLVGYLREGIDALEQDLARDGARLVALDGWVMLLHSSAFDGEAQDLMPAKDLTLIGTYAQQATSAEKIVLESTSARPHSRQRGEREPQVPGGRPRSLWIVATLVSIAGVMLWWML